MTKETAKRLETLISGMDANNIHLVSFGLDAGGINISAFCPDIAVKVKDMLLERIRAEVN